MNRFNRDFALIRIDGKIIAESHHSSRLEVLRKELADEGTVSAVVKSDLWRSRCTHPDYSDWDGSRPEPRPERGAGRE